MNKIKSWTIKKSITIEIDKNTVVAVDSLPEDIQFDIETYDKFRQDYMNNLYEQEILHYAVNSKNAAIVNKIKNYYAQQQKETTVASEGETNANTDQ